MVGERTHPTHSSSGATWAITAAAVTAAAGLVAARVLAAGVRPLWRRVQVEGTSMLPVLEPGDRLLLVRARRYRPGQLVGVEDPRAHGRLLVKRVHATGDGTIDVRGDNEDASTDSRHFGPVATGKTLGRVVYRYAPASRAGPLS